MFLDTHKNLVLCFWTHNIQTCNFVTSITERDGDGVIMSSFCMLLKLNWDQFKLECYNFRILNVIPMETTKKIVIEYTPKEMKKELKHFTTKSNKHKRYSNAGNEGQKVTRYI